MCSCVVILMPFVGHAKLVLAHAIRKAAGTPEGRRRRSQHAAAVLADARGLVFPGQEAEIVCPLHDLLLQPQKGFCTLSIQHGHIDVEQAKQAVCHIFNSGSRPAGCPRHPLRCRGVAYTARIPEIIRINSRDLRDDVRGVFLGLSALPTGVVKVEPQRRSNSCKVHPRVNQRHLANSASCQIPGGKSWR